MLGLNCSMQGIKPGDDANGAVMDSYYAGSVHRVRAEVIDPETASSRGFPRGGTPTDISRSRSISMPASRTGTPPSGMRTAANSLRRISRRARSRACSGGSMRTAGWPRRSP